jgi:hypothetical protein
VSIVRDPKGNKLSCVLLLVVERDERGPRLLRYCHDDETIDLATRDEVPAIADVPTVTRLAEANGGEARPNKPGSPEFLVVWSPTLAETNLKELDEQARDRVERVFGARFQATRDELEKLRTEHAALLVADEEKTIELRLLHRERDPRRFETAVRERVEAATAALEAKVRGAAVENADLKRQIEELQRGKKKLREALDRLKDAT